MKYRVQWREWLRSGNVNLEGHEVQCSGESIILAKNEDDVKEVMKTLFRRMEIVSVIKEI